MDGWVIALLLLAVHYARVKVNVWMAGLLLLAVHYARVKVNVWMAGLLLCCCWQYTMLELK